MSNDPSALIIALIVVIVLGFVVRWVFKPSHPRIGARGLVDATESSERGELGMLVVVKAAVPRVRALEVRNTLGDAGIRASVSRRHDGATDVLVFASDADRARELLR